mgnify:CR=1 FL=1
MAYVTKKDQMRYIEFGSFIVDYNEGDVIVLENVNDISPLFPLKPATTLIAICCKGHQRIVLNTQATKLATGTVMLCPTNLRVIVENRSNDFECKVLCLSDHLIRGLLHDRIDVWHRLLYTDQQNLVTMPEMCKSEFNFYFTILRSKLKKTTPVPPYEILLALLRAFLLELCFHFEADQSNHRDHKLSQGKMLFNRFLSTVSGSIVKRQPITYYASQLAITPKYLTMLCLKYSDKTASQWVAQYTVEEIRYYLKSTDLSIKEISGRLGFSNMSHFGSYVRKHLGMSPSEYRYSRKE